MFQPWWPSSADADSVFLFCYVTESWLKLHPFGLSSSQALYFITIIPSLIEQLPFIPFLHKLQGIRLFLYHVIYQSHAFSTKRLLSITAYVSHTSSAFTAHLLPQTAYSR